MKRTQMLILAAAAALISFSSCGEKCTSCYYEFDYKLVSGDGTVLVDGSQSAGDPQEYCGTSSEIEAAEDDYQEFVDNEVEGYEDSGYEVTIIESGCERE